MLQKPASPNNVMEIPPRAYDSGSVMHRARPESDTSLGLDCDIEVAIATDRIDDPVFCQRWRELVAASNSSQKIYQTPEFFRFLNNSGEDGMRLEVLSMISSRDGAIVGIVPVRLDKQTLHFKLGPVTLLRVRVDVASILGSVPAGPADGTSADHLAWRMLALFPDTKALYMQALPRSSAHWKNLSESIASGRGLAKALIGPWQDCHTLSVPLTFDQYLKRFSTKKRYNLNRQIRQLGEQAGKLELVRIERPEQTGDLADALNSLLSGTEMAALPSEETYARLAAQGLLLSYVLKGNGIALAAVIGTRSPDVMHVHNIFVGKKYLALSVGTSAMHQVVEDLVGLGGFNGIDFGYGTPNHDFRSSHVLEMRAKVLLFDRMRSVSLLFFVHTVFNRLSEALARTVKAFRKRWQSLRGIRS